MKNTLYLFSLKFWNFTIISFTFKIFFNQPGIYLGEYTNYSSLYIANTAFNYPNNNNNNNYNRFLLNPIENKKGVYIYQSISLPFLFVGRFDILIRSFVSILIDNLLSNHLWLNWNPWSFPIINRLKINEFFVLFPLIFKTSISYWNFTKSAYLVHFNKRL